MCSFHLGENGLRHCVHNPFIAAWLSASSSSRVGHVDLAASPYQISNLSSVSVRFPSGSFQGHLVAPYPSPAPAKSASACIQLLNAAFFKLLRTETQTTDSTQTHVNSSWLVVAVGRVLMILNSLGSAVGKRNGTAC